MLMMVASVCKTLGQELSQDNPSDAIVRTCRALVDSSIQYDAGYYAIQYPMGDVPADRGCCTDAVIRVLRKLGIDLQELVHKDIISGERLYWYVPEGDSVVINPYKGIKANKNIDHRRVWTLLKYFKYNSFPYACCVYQWDIIDEKHLQPGDIIIWDMYGGMRQGHIGIYIGGEDVFQQVGNGQEIYPDLHTWPIVAAFRLTEHWWHEIGYYNYMKINKNTTKNMERR